MSELKLNPDNTVSWEKIIKDGATLSILAEEIRREKNGLHARIKIAMNSILLAHDDLGVATQQRRTALARSAHTYMNGLAKIYTENDLRHDLDIFTDELPKRWEEDRFVIKDYDINAPTKKLIYVLYPFIIEGGGTILFAAPGTGKSYTLIAMAASIGSGYGTVFHTGGKIRPVLYINLERSEVSMQRRFNWVSKGIGMGESEHRVSFLSARGVPFASLSKKIAAWRQENPNGVGMVDSISRLGGGKLVDDDAANELMNWMNRSFETWVAIGHTPRADQDHIFGSVHFDAAADVCVKVSGERVGECVLGLSLEVTKANDIGFPEPYYMALEFAAPSKYEGSKLIGIRRAAGKEFVGLQANRKLTPMEKIKEFLLSNGAAYAGQIEAGTGLKRNNISTYLSGSPDDFVLVKEEGGKKFYGVKI